MNQKILFAFVLFSVVILFGCVNSSNSNSSVKTNSTPIKSTTPNVATNYSFVPAPDISTLNSTPIFYNSNGWQIRGHLYSSSSNPKKAILLLPALGQTLDDYPLTLISRLHQAIPDAIIMPIDMRGSGESINLGTFDSFTQTDILSMKDDLSSAKSYFAQNYPSVNQYYLVGSEYGASLAINYAATDSSVSKVVLLSPSIEQNNVSIRNALSIYRGQLFVASSDPSITSFCATSPSNPTVKQCSNGVGAEMFGIERANEENLEIAITNFLK